MSGVISRGVRAPIIREGDDIVKLTADAVEAAMAEEGFELHERDIVAVTESVVARSDGNYASVDDIAADVRAKLGGETVAVVFPILSRNRFAICLRGIARGSKKVVLMLSYPSDEVGNHLINRRFTGPDAFSALKDFVHRHWAPSNGENHVLQAVFDALADLNFILT